MGVTVLVDDSHLTLSAAHNWGGEVFAMILTSSACNAGPYGVEVTEEVAQLRDRALLVLSESPN
jgi:hypothetical protein